MTLLNIKNNLLFRNSLSIKPLKTFIFLANKHAQVIDPNFVFFKEKLNIKNH